jgi:hypothetical protein
MTDHLYPALSTFELMARPTASASSYGQGIAGVDDNVQLRVAPSGVSIRGRFWREGRYLKAVVHVQAAGMSPKTISVQVDLQPIAKALKKRGERFAQSGVRVGGWPGSFIKAVSKIGKSKLLSNITSAVKSVVKSKLTGAVVGAAAVVFPPVGVPAAAAYATANAAIATIDRANQIKNQARDLLVRGTPAQKAALSARSGQVAQALSQAATVKTRLREIATRAQHGDLAAKKTARIFSHVMAHRRRVQEHGVKLQGKQMTPGLLVTDLGRIIPGRWLFAAAAEQGAPLLASTAAAAPRLAAAKRRTTPLLKSASRGALTAPAPARARQAVPRKQHR